MEFSRQEYWSGLPFPSPGDLLNPGIEPGYPALKADSLLLSHRHNTKTGANEVTYKHEAIFISSPETSSVQINEYIDLKNR